MGEKKSKALARELIEDLLNEQETKPLDDLSAGAEQSITSEQLPDSRSLSDDFAQSSGQEDDKTIDIAQVEDSHSEKIPPVHQIDIPSAETLVPQNKDNNGPVRASVGRYGALRSSGAATVTEAALAQSESLRIAQGRILELEQEIERLRQQNEQLGAAGETLRRRADELLALNQQREGDYQYAVSTFEQEKNILQSSKEALQRDLENNRRKNEELELRISTNIQKIRVRERELENRLELVKMEGAALIRSKDELILELKRQIDQLNMELSNFRTKNQELNRFVTDKQEILRRTVKALRLALSMLEGEEDSRANAPPQRKAK